MLVRIHKLKILTFILYLLERVLTSMRTLIHSTEKVTLDKFCSYWPLKWFHFKPDIVVVFNNLVLVQWDGKRLQCHLVRTTSIWRVTLAWIRVYPSTNKESCTSSQQSLNASKIHKQLIFIFFKTTVGLIWLPIYDKYNFIK